jgi:hypothetical protein
MRFWDLGRQPDDELWGKGRRRLYQTMDGPDLLGALPRRYRWIAGALFVAGLLAWMVLTVKA